MRTGNCNHVAGRPLSLWLFPGLTRLLATALLLLPIHLLADNLRVAVASNFAPVLAQLTASFEEQSGHSLTLIPGATGQHYTQIVNGAPFDVFLAADDERPRLLEEGGHAVAGTRFTYAVGKLVLWSPDASLVDTAGAVLESSAFRYLAMANPSLAPYGEAARQVLDGMGQWEALQGRLVQGENITQTLQFVQSGNAELGFIAWSQWLEVDPQQTGSHWEIPAQLYSPMAQQGVLLRDSPAARALLDFLQSTDTRALIQSAGYDLP